MPCNLAVSITHAAVTNDYLASLLTPEIVAQIMRAYLMECGLHEDVQSMHKRASNQVFAIEQLPDGSVRCRIGGYYGIDLLIGSGGVVTVTTTYANQREEAEQWQQQIAALLSQAADQLFAAAIQQQLGSLISSTQLVAVENDGMPQQATVFTILVGGSK